MFDLVVFLKSVYPRYKWKNRIIKFLANNRNVNIKEDSTGAYIAFYDDALLFAYSIEIETVRLNIIIKIQQFKINKLSTEIKHKVDEVKVKSISLESQHFNIFGVSNIEMLGVKISETINESKIVETKTLVNRGRVFQEYVYALSYKYAFNSTKTNLTTIRNVLQSNIKDKEKLEIALDEFKFSNIIYDAMNDKSMEIRTKNINDVLPNIHIKTLHEFIEKSRNYIDAVVTKKNKREVFTYLAVAMTLSTGLRLTDWFTQSEIIKIADFKINVVGLGKKRASTKVDSKAVPTLFLSADEILKIVPMLRNCIQKGVRNRSSRDKMAHQLVNFDFVPSELWVKGSKFSYFRGLYAVTCERIYNQLNPNEADIKSQESYFINLLGHEAGTSAYQHYMKTTVIVGKFDLKAYHKKAFSALI